MATAVPVPALAVEIGAPAHAVATTSSAGAEVTVIVDGHDALAPRAAEVGTDWALAVAVELPNDLSAAATVAEAGDGSRAGSHTLAPGGDAACTDAQFAPTALGLTERDVRVTTQADWTALGAWPRHGDHVRRAPQLRARVVEPVACTEPVEVKPLRVAGGGFSVRRGRVPGTRW